MAARKPPRGLVRGGVSTLQYFGVVVLVMPVVLSILVMSSTFRCDWSSIVKECCAVDFWSQGAEKCSIVVFLSQGAEKCSIVVNFWSQGAEKCSIVVNFWPLGDQEPAECKTADHH